MWQELARAKVNLCLHVTGQRYDGLHELESLVTFPKIGDKLTFEKSDDLRLTIGGPFAGGLSDDNLVLTAARMMGVTGHFHLTKKIPVASGIGGGSADAAAAIRLIVNVFDLPLPDTQALMQLGADVPVCIQSRAAIMSGAGEDVRPIELPTFGMVLVNAGLPVSTAAVFSALKTKSNPPMDGLATVPTASDLFDYLKNQRNDLEAPAIVDCPIISDVLATLASDPTCAVPRMSGSGGTCFGVFETSALAKLAADRIRALNPDWWVEYA